MNKINLYLSIILGISIFYLYKIVRITFFFDKNNSLENFFFLISIILYIILIIVIFFKTNETKINFLLISITFSLTLLLIDKVLYLYNKQSFSTKDKFIYYQNKLKEDKNYFVSVQPNNIDYNKFNLQPLGSKSLVKTIHCNEHDFYSEYLSDRYGFNNNDKIWDLENINIILIGDSYVHGACVNPENNIASIISKLSNKSVLNLGFSSNGPLMEFATLKEYGSKKKIDELIWVYYEGNDMYDLQQEKNNKILINYLNNKNFSQSLHNKQSLIDIIFQEKLKSEINYFLKKDNFYSINLPNIRSIIKTLLFNDKVDENTYIYFEKIMIAVNNYCKENNIKFTFIYLPNFYDFNKYDEKVFKILNLLNINYININKKINKNQIEDMLPSTTPGHLNEFGYKILSEIIYKSLN